MAEFLTPSDFRRPAIVPSPLPIVYHLAARPAGQQRGERLVKFVIDIFERGLMAILFIDFCSRIGFARMTDPVNFGMVVIEVLGIFYIFTRKRGEVITDPYAFTIAILGTTFPLLVSPSDHMIAPAWFGVLFVLSGLCFSIAGLLSLNDSFGLVAANRGVKRGGPYKYMRHPIYAGYMLTHIGFLSQNFSNWNLMVYAFGWALLLMRILAEEAFLGRDEKYQEYQGTVRYRLAPGVF